MVTSTDSYNKKSKIKTNVTDFSSYPTAVFLPHDRYYFLSFQVYNGEDLVAKGGTVPNT